MILMCKNKAVYNTDTCELINPNLAPGILAAEPAKEIFRRWAQGRYSSNVYARHMQGGLFGQGNRQHIDRVTKSLSLSDCYWMRSEDSTAEFGDISPYYVDFWKGGAEYKGQAVPTLYTDGVLPKYWLNKDWLVKESKSIEYDCYLLCNYLGVPAAEVQIKGDKHIAVRNFTSPSVMFEPADISGRLDVADYTYEDIANVFEESGITMLVIDAVIGNIDRHTGNFGFLRSSDTGEYLGMAPLFDFDQALSEHEVDYILIKRTAQLLHKLGKQDIGITLADKVIEINSIRSEFHDRARILKKQLT